MTIKKWLRSKVYWLGHLKRWIIWCLREKQLCPWNVGHVEPNPRKWLENLYDNLPESEKKKIQEWIDRYERRKSIGDGD